MVSDPVFQQDVADLVANEGALTDLLSQILGGDSGQTNQAAAKAKHGHNKHA